MKLRGSLLVIVCCLVVEFCDINQKEYLFFASVDLKYTIWFLAIPGLLFLLYPLVGHLTDVYLTRYRSLKWSFCFLILAVSMGAFYAGFLIPVSIIEKFQIFRHSRSRMLVCRGSFFYFISLRLGLFQANDIQNQETLHSLINKPSFLSNDHIV